ncbi:hypothetical protein KJ966_29375 [bacterium]|nr:hypothetical protein [bacterium]
MSSRLFVFREQTYLFGILSGEFDKYLSLNHVIICQDEQHPNLWKFEATDTGESGYFIHPMELFGFGKIKFSQKSILFIRNQPDSPAFGLLMNDFYMHINDKRAEPKRIEPDVVKNFPPQLPKPVFQFVRRFKRKNIFVINPDALLKEYNIQFPETSQL